MKPILSLWRHPLSYFAPALAAGHDPDERQHTQRRRSEHPPQDHPNRLTPLPALFAGLFATLVFPAAVIAESITYDGTDPSLLGDPIVSYPGSNNAANYTPQVGALFSKTSSSGNYINFTGGNIYVANPGVAGRTGAAGDVFGGIGDISAVTRNGVSISGGQVNNVYGGLGAGVNVNYNTVRVGNATVRGSVYGGRIILGSNISAQYNSANIDPGSTIYGNIYGAYSAVSGTFLQTNYVTISGGDIRSSIISGAYAFISGVDVRANSVNISGGTINSADIYGGRGQSALTNTSEITNNRVTISGGNINIGKPGYGIYGGQNITGNGALVGSNIVAISGGNINADIYGGYNAGNGNTNGNSVSISGGGITGNIYGGYSRSNGAVFNNTVSISDVAIAGDIYGGYSASGLVTDNVVNYGVSSGDIIFGNAILGTSELNKTGAGTLVLTGDNSAIDGPVNIGGGTLQLGNGGATGNVAASGGFAIGAGAALAYAHSNDVTETQAIIGGGAVVQRGAGTLTLQNTNNYFIGGTVIESGTLRIADYFSYNQAFGQAPNAGYITFAGAGEKNVDIETNILTNSFRTGAGAGDNNYVNFQGLTSITGVNISDDGGAFYVAPSTTMNVNAVGYLGLGFNFAGGQPNDLYVGNNGTFNLNLSNQAQVMFLSGIDGDGALNISGHGAAQMINVVPNFPMTFQMGTTEVDGSGNVGNDMTILTLARLTDPTIPRVTFSNTDTFSLIGNDSSPIAAVLQGDGIVTADTINVNSGALMPTAVSGPATLTLQAPAINLTDFNLLYSIYGPQAPLPPVGTDNVPTSNNTLLYLDGTTVNANRGAVYFVTMNGLPFENGEYLVIKSSAGFGATWDPGTSLTAYLDGFPLTTSTAGSPRGGTAQFMLGGDPDPSTGGNTAGTQNVWFSAADFSSLSMDWTGTGDITKADSGSWMTDPYFYSLQTGIGDAHETYFMTGDKVYISGNTDFAVDLPAATLDSKIVVSGLVVGKDAGGSITDGGKYTISGDGGITADATSAFGQYVDTSLLPTGKLEKFGNSKLTFTNTGGNLFVEGIDIYGGTIAFNQADQLGVGAGAAIIFKGNATLEANSDSDMALDTPIGIEDAQTATLQVGGDKTLLLNGIISGDGALNKTDTGTLLLTGINSYTGETTVNGGTLNVEGSIASSAMTTVNGGATLTGTGTVGNTTIATGGTFAPGNGTPGSSMAVAGNLSLQTDAQYVTALNADTASLAKVQGAATLGGATVNAIYANDRYVEKRYTILTATDGVSGNFDNLVHTNLPVDFVPSLGYDANNAYLDLTLRFGMPGDLNTNQQNVGDGLNDYFNKTGSIPPLFGTLTPNDLTQLSGELATATQQATFDAMNQFVGLMSDPTLAGRNECGLASTDERETVAGKTPTDCLAQPWSVWTMAYGGRRTTDGDTALGSHDATSRIYGVAVGADYHISRGTLAGFALAGGGTNFDVAGGLGSGSSNLFQIGAFMQQAIRDGYLRAGLAYGWQDITTDRTVTIDGIDQFRADFNANAITGRLEGGYRFDTAWAGLTPYAAGQFTTFDLPGYSERTRSGSNMFALRYDSETVTASRSELGLRADRSMALADGPLTLSGRLAWAHNFENERKVTAEFQTLPGSSFEVNGAAIDGDAALATVALEMKWRNGWSAAIAFDGEFSDVSRLYAGWGLLRYQW